MTEAETVVRLLIENDEDDLSADDVQSVEPLLPNYGYVPVEHARSEGFDFEGSGWVRRLPGARVFVSVPDTIGERTVMFRGDGPELWRRQMTDAAVLDMLIRLKSGVRESNEEDELDWKEVTHVDPFASTSNLFLNGGWIEVTDGNGEKYVRQRYQGNRVVHTQHLVWISLNILKLYDNEAYIGVGFIQDMLPYADELWSKSAGSSPDQ